MITVKLFNPENDTFVRRAVTTFFMIGRSFKLEFTKSAGILKNSETLETRAEIVKVIKVAHDRTSISIHLATSSGEQLVCTMDHPQTLDGSEKLCQLTYGQGFFLELRLSSVNQKTKYTVQHVTRLTMK